MGISDRLILWYFKVKLFPYPHCPDDEHIRQCSKLPVNFSFQGFSSIVDVCLLFLPLIGIHPHSKVLSDLGICMSFHSGKGALQC